MKKDFSELIEYLDKKFQKTATKEDLSKLATQESLNKVSVLTISNTEDIKEIKQEISELKKSVQALVSSVDKLVKAVDDLKTEYASVKNQVTRHEAWLHQLAEKLGVKLE